MTIDITVPGDPSPKGSYTMRPDGGMISGRSAGTTKKYKIWKKALELAARDTMGHVRVREGRRKVWIADPERPPLDGAIAVTIVFYYPRLKNETRAERLRLWKTSAPDIDKLTRAVFDPLNEVVIADDARIASLRAEKRYIAYGDVDSLPRAEIRITQIPEGD